MSIEQEAMANPSSKTAECPHSKLLEDALSPAVQKAAVGEPRNNDTYIDKMSTLVADVLDNHKFLGLERISPTGGVPSDISTKLLSNVLASPNDTLNDADYNKMLLAIKTKNDAFANNPADPLNERPWMQHLHLDNWNEKTGTWDNVSVDESQFPNSKPTRFVQPGNTLDSIADDRLAQIYKNSAIPAWEHKEMKSEIVRANNLKYDADNNLYRGEAIKLPR